MFFFYKIKGEEEEEIVKKIIILIKIFRFVIMLERPNERFFERFVWGLVCCFVNVTALNLV